MSLSLRFAVCGLLAFCGLLAICGLLAFCALLRALLCSMSTSFAHCVYIAACLSWLFKPLKCVLRLLCVSGNFGLARWVLLQEIPAPQMVAMGSLYSGTLLDL